LNLIESNLLPGWSSALPFLRIGEFSHFFKQMTVSKDGRLLINFPCTHDVDSNSMFGVRNLAVATVHGHSSFALFKTTICLKSPH
jgi:hypothetical protein